MDPWLAILVAVPSGAVGSAMYNFIRKRQLRAHDSFGGKITPVLSHRYQAPFTEIRIERIAFFSPFEAMAGLIHIDLDPPSTGHDGAEMGLTFGTALDCLPVSEDFLRSEVERMTQKPVLASRRYSS